MDEMGERKVEIVVIPFSDGQGHINPILGFSKRLASKGVSITVLNVHNNNDNNNNNDDNNNNLNDVGASIKFVHKAREPYEGIKPESLESYVQRFQTSTSFHLTNLITQHNETSNAPIACVVYDSLMSWILPVARQFGLLGATFFTESCAVNALYYHIHRGSLTIPADDGSVVSLPSLPPLRFSDFPSLIPNPDQYPVFLKLLIDQFSNNPDWMLINTFPALEPQILHWMQSHMPLKVVGPTVPSIQIDKGSNVDDEINNYRMNRIKSTKHDDDRILEWLDSKERNTVIYVSFGSVSEIGEVQMKELAWGLKETNTNFLWVIRETKTPKVQDQNIIVEEISKIERGMVVKWCSQVQVLAHKSVGCFVSHCGWNSVLEALTYGVPMVAMPQFSDQMTNAKFVDDVWKVGVRVSPNENGIVGREEIDLCIRQVMKGERSFEIRQNATKWMNLAKEAMVQGEVSDRNIDEFAAQLKHPKTSI